MIRVLLHGSAMIDRAHANRELERAFGLPIHAVTGPESLRAALGGHPDAQVLWQGHGAAVAWLGAYADRIEAVLGAFDHIALETD